MTRLVVGIPLLDEDGVRIMEVGQGRRDVRARQVWTHQHDRLVREQPRHLGGLRKGIVPERLADHGDARSRDEPHEERAGGQGQSPPIRGGGHARQQSDDGQGAEKHREREDDRHVPPHRSKWSTEHAEGVLWNTGGMYRVELYAAVRRSVYVEGWSARAAARRFGLARETVRKMLRYRLPPGYRRQQPIRCPKLEAFTGVIDQILRDDQHRPKKQRHTAKRICERLRAEHDFTGGYTIVKAYVREQKLGGQEMFVPLAHPFVPLCPALSRIPRLLVEWMPRNRPPEGTFMHLRAAERATLCSSHNPDPRTPARDRTQCPRRKSGPRSTGFHGRRPVSAIASAPCG